MPGARFAVVEDAGKMRGKKADVESARTDRADGDVKGEIKQSPK